jgi:metal-responsive CopG/Arc/MetJ family transcriptional regulator
MSTKGKVRITLRLNKDLLDRVRSVIEFRKGALSEFVEGAIREKLEKEKKRLKMGKIDI